MENDEIYQSYNYQDVIDCPKNSNELPNCRLRLILILLGCISIKEASRFNEGHYTVMITDVTIGNKTITGLNFSQVTFHCRESL